MPINCVSFKISCFNVSLIKRTSYYIERTNNIYKKSSTNKRWCCIVKTHLRLTNVTRSQVIPMQISNRIFSSHSRPGAKYFPIIHFITEAMDGNGFRLPCPGIHEIEPFLLRRRLPSVILCIELEECERIVFRWVISTFSCSSKPVQTVQLATSVCLISEIYLRYFYL